MEVDNSGKSSEVKSKEKEKVFQCFFSEFHLCLSHMSACWMLPAPTGGYFSCLLSYPTLVCSFWFSRMLVIKKAFYFTASEVNRSKFVKNKLTRVNL